MNESPASYLASELTVMGEKHCPHDPDLIPSVSLVGDFELIEDVAVQLVLVQWRTSLAVKRGIQAAVGRRRNQPGPWIRSIAEYQA
jgi:hypothetical protein